ncbi:hypothetical protein OKA05_00720 [Luteolibacter arcticus]|uniref:Zinc ribbon domain-containing protein n=1 Tax=Luteolibacter arcticus TaxID=1581411 RepID=A0ABT3GBQ5_9BACT|nr:hypothetical protein [Luteolibacter arcticus]MCW1921055.1 hypothetical protein [Luteolibacter arcticus]
MEEETDTYLCPGCDREVRVGSRGCPHCNADAPGKRLLRKKQRPKAAAKRARVRKSWEQDPSYDGLDLPDEDFDYDDFVAREFGHKPHRKIGIKWYWWVTAIVVVVLIVLAGFELGGWGRNAWK